MNENEKQSYVLEITWAVVDMPGLVGPFKSVGEAEAWAKLNIPNGTWATRPMHRPYARAGAVSS